MSLAPDRTLSEVETEHPLAVVLPGGIQGVRQLNADPRVHTLLRRVVEQEGYLLALDTGYIIVRMTGTLNKPEGGPVVGSVSSWRGDGLSSQRVVVEGQVIFGRDSGVAQESALTLAALLEGESWTRQGSAHRAPDPW